MRAVLPRETARKKRHHVIPNAPAASPAISNTGLGINASPAIAHNPYRSTNCLVRLYARLSVIRALVA